MCRLYRLQANEPTRVECSLVEAQNALMVQSRRDREGLVHGHGWGIADHSGGLPSVEKQASASRHGEHFRKAAARIYATTVVAHVRRATVGPPTIENAHPFAPWTLALRAQWHNSGVPKSQSEVARCYRSTASKRNRREHRQRAYVPLPSDVVAEPSGAAPIADATRWPSANLDLDERDEPRQEGRFERLVDRRTSLRRLAVQSVLVDARAPQRLSLSDVWQESCAS